MNKRNIKFAVGILIIIVSAIWFGITGFREGNAYYLTADELVKMKNTLYNKRIRVAGKVVPNSIERKSDGLKFNIEQNNIIIPVSYSMNEPIPDTFNDNVQVVVSGKLKENGIFESDAIQAKCASKYEAMND
jgi:cytochrome c-type biogenesis protein CcmE